MTQKASQSDEDELTGTPRSRRRRSQGRFCVTPGLLIVRSGLALAEWHEPHGCHGLVQGANDVRAGAEPAVWLRIWLQQLGAGRRYEEAVRKGVVSSAWPSWVCV